MKRIYRVQKEYSKRCLVCNKLFYKTSNLAWKEWNKNKYCSRQCYWTSLKGKKLSQLAYNNLTLATKGKGQGWIHQASGYKIMVHPVTGKRITKHRYVLEQHLGRRLNKWEHTHHINHIKTDNRIENLMILSNSEHWYKHHQSESKN